MNNDPMTAYRYPNGVWIVESRSRAGWDLYWHATQQLAGDWVIESNNFDRPRVIKTDGKLGRQILAAIRKRERENRV